jgi:hypothetical protein
MPPFFETAVTLASQSPGQWQIGVVDGLIQLPPHPRILILDLSLQVGIADGAKPRGVFEVFEFPFQILGIDRPCSDHHPVDAGMIDGPQQLGSHVRPVGNDPEPKVFGVTQVVTCVMIFLLEVNQIHMGFLSYHISSKQKKGCPKGQPFFFLLKKLLLFTWRSCDSVQMHWHVQNPTPGLPGDNFPGILPALFDLVFQHLSKSNSDMGMAISSRILES